MGEGRRGYEHRVMGVIHEIELTAPGARVLAAALAHERDRCHAHSVIVDLRRVGDGVDDDDVRVIVEHVEPDIRRWAVRVPEAGSDDLIRRLDAAGLGAVLIRGDGVAGPRPAGPPPAGPRPTPGS
jgi:hypothetical protein